MTLVLMTADAVGGVWSYALELARALAPRGVRVALATMGAPPSAAQRTEAAAVPTLTLHESAYRLEWMDDPWEDVERAGEWLLQLERELRPDLVHVNGYAHGALPFRTPAVVVAHSCVCSWWRAVKGERAPAAWDRYRAAAALGLAGAGVVVAPTRAMLDALQREHRTTLECARVVPNGRDAARHAPTEWILKEPFVLTAGRLWDEAKNVAALGAVAPRLPWPIFVAGDERHPNDGASPGASPIAPALRPLGRLSGSELACWMTRAAVFALPARYEPFGLSALEAALSGCALVLGDIPSLREVWDDAATYVAPDDHDALADALRALMTDETRRRASGERARRRALEYSVERMGEGYMEAYESAIQGGLRDAGRGSPAQRSHRQGPASPIPRPARIPQPSLHPDLAAQ